ncbi:MAG: hypothetical protein HC908_03940, partial [Calothrix sp. SM1_7_51]|nr:hypothetical protein [Calothrix sp. SM1_7_51]
MDTIGSTSKPTRSSKRHKRQGRKQSKVKKQGIYARAIKDAFVKLNPKHAV